MRGAVLSRAVFFRGFFVKKRIVFFDFETYSPVDIALGARAYTAAHGFRPVILAYAEGNKAVKVTTDFEPVSAFKGAVCVAHNAVFDVCVYEKTFGPLPAAEITDTAALCRYWSIPPSLEKAGRFLGLGGKDDAGAGLLKKLTLEGRLSKPDMKQLERYAARDVELLRDLYRAFGGKQPDHFAKKVHDLHLRMNETGIRVDTVRAGFLLKKILNVKKQETARAVKRFGLYGDEKPVAASADQVKKYLARNGTPAASIAEKDLEDFLSVSEMKLPKKSRELVNFYREIQSRGADKLQKIVSFGLERIYDSSIFHGTHTGRPAGGGINLLNVKRYSRGDDEKPFEKAVNRILRGAEPGEKVKRLSSLLWGCLLPEQGCVIIRSDLSAIEPRVGAWLRNDRRTMEIYRKADEGNGKDEYTIFGEAMEFPKEILRSLSKIVILAACYGMSADLLRVQCRGYGVPDPGEKEAAKILDGYHHRNPSVKRAWFDLVKTAVTVITGQAAILESHGCAFFAGRLRDVPFLRVMLPSGRIKSYADVRVETVGTKGWRSFSYMDPRGFRQTMRAAALYENIVQAVAVDVSFEKALAMPERAEIKLIIHDELNISAPVQAVKTVEKIMKAPVPWLPGMPVNAKTVVCSSFHKGDRI